MGTYKHLKDEIYYNDLYDRLTVDRCRRLEKNSLQASDETLKSKDLDQAKIGEIREEWGKAVTNLMMYFVSGEEYLKKEPTIRKWMERDKAKDQQVADAVEPHGVSCLSCGSTMHLESKDLMNRNGSELVLFMFRCNAGCRVGRAFWEDKREYIPKSDFCPKCHSPVTSESKTEKEVITTTHTCTKCGHVYTDVLDLTTKPPVPDPNYLADRARFCFDEKKGEEYRDSKQNVEHMTKLVDEIEAREKNKEVYNKVAAIKKLPIAEVQKLLTETVENHGYTNLQFQPPEMGKDLVVPFTAMDSKSDRIEYNSKQELKKLIEKTLTGTNWKLMGDGISYRVGYVSGRLRCLEREEDLKKLVTP
jgi:hypothetical protein